MDIGFAYGTRLSNIRRLGVKELWSLLRDPMMLLLIAYTFSTSVYVAATAQPETLHIDRKSTRLNSSHWE